MQRAGLLEETQQELVSLPITSSFTRLECIVHPCSYSHPSLQVCEILTSLSSFLEASLLLPWLCDLSLLQALSLGLIIADAPSVELSVLQHSRDSAGRPGLTIAIRAARAESLPAGIASVGFSFITVTIRGQLVKSTSWPHSQVVSPALEEVAASILHVRKSPRYHACVLTQRVLENQGKHSPVSGWCSN